MSNDKSKMKIGEGDGVTSSELEYILDVNKKAIEINIEVEKQNEEILESLEKLEETTKEVATNQKSDKLLIEGTITSLKEIKDEIEEISKNLFRLIIILGSLGIGTILSIIQTFLHK